MMSRRIDLRMRNVSAKSRRVNQNTHFIFSNFFSRKSWPLWDNVEKYCRARLATGSHIIQHELDVWWKTLHMSSQNYWNELEEFLHKSYVNVAVQSHMCVCFLLDPRVYLMLDIFWVGTQHEFMESLNWNTGVFTQKLNVDVDSHISLLSFGTFVVSGCLVFLTQSIFFFLRAWGSVFSLVTRLQVWQFRVQIPTDVRGLCFLENVQTSSRAHSVSD